MPANLMGHFVSWNQRLPTPSKTLSYGLFYKVFLRWKLGSTNPNVDLSTSLACILGSIQIREGQLIKLIDAEKLAPLTNRLDQKIT